MSPFVCSAPALAVASLKKPLSALLGLVSLLCFAPVPSAQANYVPAFSLKVPVNTDTLMGTPLLLGYQFSTDIDRDIKAVGIYNSINIPPSIRLGIWDSTDFFNPTLLFQTTVSSQGSCAGDFCWIPASSLGTLPKLLMNTNYVIATTWGSDPVPAGIENTDLTLVATNFYVADNAYNTTTLPSLDVDLANYPPDTSDTAYKKSFFTTNLSFETYDSVQTPAPLPLIGAAAAFGWSRKMRRRINSPS